MLRLMRKPLSKDAIESTKERFIKQVEGGAGGGAAWEILQPLLRAQSHQEEAAFALVELVQGGYLSRERSLEVLETVHAAHAENEQLLYVIADSLDRACDIDMLNAAPPESELFATVVDKLAVLAVNAKGAAHEAALLTGLATAARMMARQRDELAEIACRRLLQLEPDASYRHYNFGLLMKTRGRFHEGMVANQRAAMLAEKVPNATEWNLGICATGARDGAIALEVWKRMNQKIEMGRFGLPEGSYPSCKVRLAERPLAERTKDHDDPGLEETIWIERLSPCHGIIRSVLYQSLGVDYGDVILMDGAPITYHKYGDREVPVHPHLATLVRSNYQLFDFAGTQDEKGRIHGASEDLDGDSVIYSHSENFTFLCAGCWRDQGLDHQHTEKEEKHVVRGKIAAAPDVDPSELLRQLDAAMAKRSPCRVYAPGLCGAAGQPDRAAVEQRRFDMLQQS